MKARAIVALCASLGLSAALTSVTHADEGAKKPLTPEVAITQRSESDVRFSPDGRRVAVVVNDALKGTGRKRHIWVLDVSTRQLRQFTFSEKSEYSPRWSPDGRTLAFLSNRGEQTQIYFLSIDGGDPRSAPHCARSGRQ